MQCVRLARSLAAILALLLVCGCVALKGRTQTPCVSIVSPMPEEPGVVPIKVDLMGVGRDVEVRRVRFATLHPGERRSVQQGEDLLRVGRYDEEVLLLPKMRASRDFRIVLDDDTPIVFDGYSNVTYECLRVDRWFKTLLFGGVFGMLEMDDTLSSTFYLPSGLHGKYRSVQGRVEPANVTFRRVRRTHVMPETENQYVLRYLGKQGMQLEFELRRLCGGSRPRVVQRERILVPLGAPLAEVAGHEFRIHTATPEILDVTLIR